METHQSDTAQSHRLRFSVIIDTQTNGSTAIVNDIIESGGGNSYEAFRELTNTGRFRWLYDKRFIMNRNTAAFPTDSSGNTETLLIQGTPVDKQWDCSFNVNIPIEYDGTTGATSEIKSNNILIFWTSDSALPNCDLSCVMRVRYEDSWL